MSRDIIIPGQDDKIPDSKKLRHGKEWYKEPWAQYLIKEGRKKWEHEKKNRKRRNREGLYVNQEETITARDMNGRFVYLESDFYKGMQIIEPWEAYTEEPQPKYKGSWDELIVDMKAKDPQIGARRIYTELKTLNGGKEALSHSTISRRLRELKKT